MKRIRFISLLLAMVMILPIISVCAFAEESSNTPDEDSYTVNIVGEGEGRKSFDIEFNEILKSGDTFTDWHSPLDIRISPKDGYKIVDAFFEPEGFGSFSQVEDSFLGTCNPELGKVYVLHVVTEATASVTKNTLSVSCNEGVKYTVLDKNNLDITGSLSVAEFAEGDKVTVKFDVGGSFDASKATLSVNGSSVTPSAEYSFNIAKGENKVVFNYDFTAAPSQAKLTVDSGSITYAVFVNDVEADAKNPVFYAGDTVKITFNVEGDFDPAKALLLHGGKKMDMSGTSYTFTAADNNKIVFKYGEMPAATLTVSGNGKNLSSISSTVSVNGSAVDASAYEFKVGDSVTVVFDVTVENSADAFCKVNGNNVSLSGNSVSFIIDSESNTVVFGYGVVPVVFVLNGPGYYTVNKEGTLVGEVRNNSASGKASKTLYLNKNEQYTFTVNPALNYELSGGVEISEPRKDLANGIYYFTPGGETTVNASFKVAAVTVPTFPVKFNVHMGGTLTIGTMVIIGGTGGQMDVAEGQGVIISVTPDEGYEIDRLIVDGVEVQLDNNSYTISGINKAITVDAFFKSDASIDMSTAIGVDGVDWNAETIIIDVRGNRPVKRDVLAKIATLDKNSGKFVEFVGDAGTIYVPYGGVFSGTSEVLMINVTEMRNGNLYTAINNAISEQDGIGTVFRAYSINITENMPAGSKIAFNLGTGFFGCYASLRTFDGSSFVNVADAALASGSGVSAKYDYSNQPALVCVKEEGVEDTSDVSGEDASGNVSDVSESGKGGGANTVIAIVIIVLVAVAGAAALFIVKWRQEKF